jgi:hypothetical protein
VNDTIPPRPEPVHLTIHPTGVPPTEIPHGMLHDVCQVLDAHGLHVTAPELRGLGVVEVLMAIGAVLDKIPTAYGGRAPERPWIGGDSGPGWSPDK